MDTATIICTRCKEEIAPQAKDAITTGYGIDAQGNLICYACCAEGDKEYMRKEGRITLYLTMASIKIKSGWVIDSSARITNWPGSLEFIPTGHNIKISQTNWGLTRRDLWFAFDNHYWHGVNVGDNSQLLHCKMTKQLVKPIKRHYVGIAGLYGYMPNYCDVFRTKGDAAECLGQIHELSGRAIARLRRDQWIDLDLREYGNEYCEIIECDCNEPEIHSENGEVDF